MHIQDPSQAKELVPHWGYADRVLPCVNDAGTCEYLDSIYSSHDLSVRFSFIFWIIIAFVLVVWSVFRLFDRFGKKNPSKATLEVEGQQNSTSNSLLARSTRTTITYLRRKLYSKFPGTTFGHASRLQVLILAIISGYLSLFSLIGITYKSWDTPHMDDPSIYDTRTGFAGFADRIGIFAYTLTPLTIFLSTRESILTLVTGISYQHFNFLHRWTGRLIFIYGCMHTFGWMVIKGCLYQPQPSVFVAFMIQPYIIWGSASIGFLVFLYVFSIKSVIQRTGYEFFLISHSIAAVMFIATCWKHWPNLSCWMIASVTVLLLDIALRALYFFLIHFKIVGTQKGFVPAQASLQLFDDPNGKVIRLDFEHAHRPWKAGQHFFLTFPALSIWQSHPFTVLSSPDPKNPVQKHSYIIRSQTGETAKLGDLATKTQSTPVLLSAPYGTQMLWRRAPNILAISGGTGISFTIPIIKAAATSACIKSLQLVWIVRREQNLEWAKRELEELKSYSNIQIRILITSGGKNMESGEEISEKSLNDEKNSDFAQEEGKDSESLPSVSLDKKFGILYLNGRPIMKDIINEYLDQVESDRVLVVGSGPPRMGLDVRKATVTFNHPKQVWKGDKKKDVDFYWDY